MVEGAGLDSPVTSGKGALSRATRSIKAQQGPGCVFTIFFLLGDRSAAFVQVLLSPTTQTHTSTHPHRHTCMQHTDTHRHTYTNTQHTLLSPTVVPRPGMETEAKPGLALAAAQPCPGPATRRLQHRRPRPAHKASHHSSGLQGSYFRQPAVSPRQQKLVLFDLSDSQTRGSGSTELGRVTPSPIPWGQVPATSFLDPG